MYQRYEDYNWHYLSDIHTRKRPGAQPLSHMYICLHGMVCKEPNAYDALTIVMPGKEMPNRILSVASPSATFIKFAVLIANISNPIFSHGFMPSFAFGSDIFALKGTYIQSILKYIVHNQFYGNCALYDLIRSALLRLF